MVFLGVYRAVYDYTPQGDGELAINEGDLLFVLEKSTDDDWWKAKKKAQNEEEDEPEGLIPNNYIEEAQPMHKAKALYDYARQTDEELSFSEDATLDVYDASDPDWTLVGFRGEYGFAPANYIEAADEGLAMLPRPRASDPSPEPEADSQEPLTPSSAGSARPNPAAALAGIIAQRTGGSSAAPRQALPPPPPQQFTPEESDEDPPPPPMPQRPRSEIIPSPPPVERAPPRQYATVRSSSPPGVQYSPPYNRATMLKEQDEDRAMRSPGGFHLYNIHEMVEHAGKNKKMPVVLGINLAKGVIMISPEKSKDGPQEEWTADKLTHYSIEGKHIFMELKRPSKSIDFHAGAKDTAQEIVRALGELAGAERAEGLREVLAVASPGSQRKGQMLYDFMAQGDDEVTVAVGDQVIILDDRASDEWWNVRRLKNGKEGVVPSSYVEITGTVPQAPSSSSFPSIRPEVSFVEQNRIEEKKLSRMASKAKARESESKASEVGPGLQLPERISSRSDIDSRHSSQRNKRDSRDMKPPSTSKPKPDVSKVRTWTDRSGSFKVEAEFIGLKDGKIHLHKTNGVKIAVPVSKMSIRDLEFVERATGQSLDEDKPLSDIKRRSTQRKADREARAEREMEAGAAKARGVTAGPSSGLEIQKKPEFDWFDFFLQCGVNPQICERYSSAFTKDQMGEENMVDVTPDLCRTLGLKEGDILRVMKFLNSKFGRNKEAEGDAPEANGGTGGLFSGPGGSLKNNTRKGRPAPAVQTNDVVDPKAFEQKLDSPAKRTPTEGTPTPLAFAPKRIASGFDDNAWEPRPGKAASPPPAAAAAAAPAPPAPVEPPRPAITGNMKELSLLDTPLQPTPAPPPQPKQQPAPPPPQPQQPQPTGATPGLFEQLANQPPGQQMPQPTGFSQTPQQQQQQLSMPRQRPQAPQQITTNSLIQPPPSRAASAPQNFSQFGPPAPLQAQLTGYQPNMHTGVAPPGQSMQELNQQRMQQQQFGQQPLQPQQTGYPQQMPPQQTGFGMQNGGFNQFQNGVMPQQTGYGQQSPMQAQPTGYGSFQPQSTGYQASVQQQFINGQQTGSPFADPPRQPFQPQPTGMQNSFSPTGLQPQPTGINAYLPPALQPQPTGYGFGNQMQTQSFGQSPPPMPPMPPMPQQQSGPAMQPLVPQKTGPAPPVRFGVNPAAKKLAPQPTGRRANLSQATPQNPFGF
ncbi:hypothetical protein K402DRAFT_399718 [Aulographum hederae CBS 113979]|uniref:Actin cytoskeleton-regulatory complex protein SLA1 n=1 Tax=Aulographum hederae CBS 113979 TaxID=1176131 RepID=A0A6G1HHS4_9PEZI|nr:hypothetical protein K402DRAFT_399718 [Aulographum hederae CBS 113979]